MPIKRTTLAVAMLAVTLFSGCVATNEMNQVMRSWEGHNVKELVASWGEPSAKAGDGQGGQVLTYNKSYTVTTPASYTPDASKIVAARYQSREDDGSVVGYRHVSPMASDTVYNPPSVDRVTRTRTFWVDASGKIYRWDWKGV